MPAIYDQDGIRFLYPENWALDESDSRSMPRTIMLYLPGGGFWSLDIHPFGVRPADLIHEVIRTLQAEYQDLESTVVAETIGPEKTEGVDLYFFHLDLLIATHVRSLHRDHATYLLTYQAEDREFEKMLKVFQAINISLLGDVPDPAEND